MTANIKNEWDLFICHAWEDKGFVKPLASALSNLGVNIWYDDFELTLGDSLSVAINKGLTHSNFGLVIISRQFIGKGWSDYELKGLISKEIGGSKVILPIWYDVTVEEVKALNLWLADKKAFKTSEGDLEDIVLSIVEVVRPDIYNKHPRAELKRIATGEALRDLVEELEYVRAQIDSCPRCGAELQEKTNVEIDRYSEGSFVAYDCGYAELDGVLRHPCAKDPNYPTLHDYDLKTEYQERHSQWMCYAKPKTTMAALVHLRAMPGATEEQAKQRVIEAAGYRLKKR